MTPERKISLLNVQMAKAVAAEDFEAAARLRDQIAELQAAVDAGSLLQRQVPGQMGLGSDQLSRTPPKGWVAPPKPDLMTHIKRRGGRD
jgi:hypothetical protein